MAYGKGLFSSKTIWGIIISQLPVVYESLPDVISNVLPYLPPSVAPVVSAIGAAIAIWGRVNPDIRPISKIL